MAYFRFNIHNLFSKYSDWSYEKEYRFIILPTEACFKDYISKQGHAMTVKPFNYVFGYNFPSAFDSYLATAAIKKTTFELSDIDYKLIKK